MSARRAPWWPGTWWVNERTYPQPAVRIWMIDLASGLVANGLPLYRGAEWMSHWDVGAQVGDEVRLSRAWYRPVVGGHPALHLPRHASEIQSFETEIGELTRYAVVDGRHQLRWLERLPAALEPLINRVLELLGRGELRAGMVYTVEPP